MTNAIVEENALRTSAAQWEALGMEDGGSPRDVWDAAASNQIEGFATDISVNHGSRIDFKINLNAEVGEDVPYHIEIYRLGYYGGDGARLVHTSGPLVGGAQPDAIFDPATGMVDAGNWSVSTGWDVPADATSGVYLVKLVRDDTGDTNQIPFIVRDDGGSSDIVLQTSDTTWQAYNGWGGNNGEVGGNFYGDPSGTIDHPDVANPGLGAQDRAYAVSYNRPFITRDGGGAAAGAQDYLFGADYAAIYWLEKNGYDVSYISGVDTDRLGAEALMDHKAFISVGHDEYWSGEQRHNVEEARDAGVNLLFWSGNEMYWKTRYESSTVTTDGSPTDYRTLVCYKETWANGDPNAGPEDYANIDPSNDWTGTWRDTRFVDAVDENGNYIAGGSRFDLHAISGSLANCNCVTGAGPENSLTGQLFGPDQSGFGAAIDVPAAFANLRVWRDTSVAETGQLDMAEGILGYEWNTSPTDEFRPSGLIKLSETTVPWGAIVIDQGNTAVSGEATHNLSLYRAESGALVFGAGTVFWTWGLSDEHDWSPYGANIENLAIQQFTVNMFADMGIQPGVSNAILASQGLVRAVMSTDGVAATTTIDAPDSVPRLDTVVITGTATDDDGNPLTEDGVVALVEVSFDGGATWHVAQGTTNWSYAWRPTAEGTFSILARAIDDSLNVYTATPAGTTITVTPAVVPDSLSLFESSAPVNAIVLNEGQTVELGMKFAASRDGQITELKYFRAAADANDTDVREGHLWGPDGTLLATVTFTSAPGQSGWQVASLSAPVAITAGLEYVVSYRTSDHYVATSGYFSPHNDVAFDGIDDNAFTDPYEVLSAPESGSAGNGLFKPGTDLSMPDQTHNATNYWVDVTFDPADTANGAPKITSSTSFTVEENQTAVGTVTATDPDADTVLYSIAGGSDAAIFAIDPATGALTFVSAPNYELPGDANGDNVYEVIVRASDGSAVTNRVVRVTVTDVGEPPPDAFSLFNPAAPVVTNLYNEGQAIELGMKFTASQDGQITELKYYRAAGDASDTDVREGHLWGPGGTLLATVTFTSAPGQSGWQVASLSAPVKIAAGLEYVVSYRTSDNYVATGNFFNPANEIAFDGVDDDAFSDVYGTLSAPQSAVVGGGGQGGNGVFRPGADLAMPNETYNATNYWVDVTFDPSEAPNDAPQITSSGSFTVADSQTAVGTITAVDPDSDAVFYAIVGGADAAKFVIDATTGALVFTSAPDFQVPGDADGDNVYEVVVRASDGLAGTTQTVAVTVTGAPPPETFSLFDPSAPVEANVYNEGLSVELGMKFTAGENGQITELKYFRAAADANDTDVREGHLWGPDGTLLATVTFTSAPGQSGWQVAALSAPVAITAGLEYVVSYRTSDNYVATGGFFSPGNEVAFDGVDDNAFSDPHGKLSAPESGSAGNGVFRPGGDLAMPDQSYNATNYWVDVTFDPNDGPNGAPQITSSTSFTVEENQTAVGTVTATDPNSDTVSYAIAGGADAAKFTINAATGALAFVTAPDFESPQDADGDNIYDVVVHASDGLAVTTQAIAVTVADVAESMRLSLFDPAAPVEASLYNEGQTVELGMRFATDHDGQITELKYFRAEGDAGDVDVREAHLWGPEGTLLATATFTSAPGESGWQVAVLSAPVTIAAGLDYVVSYRTSDNYVATGGFFGPGNEVAFDGVDDDAFSDQHGVLSAPESGAVGNGVFRPGTDLAMPDQSYNATNYWVDVTFVPSEWPLV